MLRAAASRAPLSLLGSPWSPPPWMKTVKSFNGEGHLKADCGALRARLKRP